MSIETIISEIQGLHNHEIDSIIQCAAEILKERQEQHTQDAQDAFMPDNEPKEEDDSIGGELI